MKYTKGENWKVVDLIDEDRFGIQDKMSGWIFAKLDYNIPLVENEEVAEKAKLMSKASEMYEAIKAHVNDCINSGAEIPVGFESLLKEIES